MLTPEQVVEFLKSNPDFFEEHIDLLLGLEVAHPHGGRTVSIPERQLIATREKARVLEEKLAELIQFGEENDALSEKVQQLILRLIGCKSLDTTIDALYLDLLDNFSVPHVAVRLWNVALPNAAAETTPPEFADVAVELKQFIEAMTTPYCGNHPVYETNGWFGEHAPHLKSYALVPLKKDHCFGLLLMASENSERFYAEMGTLFLTRIGDVIAACIARQLTFLPPAAPDVTLPHGTAA